MVNPFKRTFKFYGKNYEYPIMREITLLFIEPTYEEKRVFFFFKKKIKKKPTTEEITRRLTNFVGKKYPNIPLSKMGEFIEKVFLIK